MRIQIPLILATLFLSILVWVYADLTSQETYEATVSIRLVVPEPSELVVRVGTGPDNVATGVGVGVQFGGSKAAIRKLDIEKRQNGLLIEVPISGTEAGTTPAQRSINVFEYVERWGQQRGLRVFDVTRRSIPYTVDRFVTIDITVEADPGLFAEELRNKPRVVPAKVQARLLASQRDAQEQVDRRIVIPIEEQLRRGAETSFEESLAGQRWAGLEVSWIPDRVTISVSRKPQFGTERLTAIPLREMWPTYRPEGRFRIVWEDGDVPPLQHVEITGPTVKLRSLKNTEVLAFVVVSEEDLTAAATATAPSAGLPGTPRDVHFLLPPGYEDVRIVSQPTKVRFQVVREEPAAVTPG